MVRDVRDLPSGRKTKGWLYCYLIPSGSPVEHIVCNFEQCKGAKPPVKFKVVKNLILSGEVHLRVQHMLYASEQ